MLERLLAPYRSAVAGTPTTSGQIARDPLLSLLLPQLQMGGGGGRSGPGGEVKTFGQGDIDELLWRTAGHEGHLHLASDDLPLVKLGKKLQGMGFDIGEHPAFGGVDPVHTKGSYHYRPGGQALDVNYRGGGRWKDEGQALDWLSSWLTKKFG